MTTAHQQDRDSDRDRHPVPFITLTNWVRAAVRCEVDIEAIFRDLDIPTDLMHLETAMVDGRLLLQLLDACTAASHKAHFPFVLGDSFSFDYLPDLGTFIDTAPNLRAATRVFDWLPQLINPAVRAQLVEGQGPARVILVDRSGMDLPYVIESWMASIVKFARLLMNRGADCSRLCLRYPAPAWADKYESFFGVPVAFGQRHHAMEFPAELLDAPRPASFPALHEQARLRTEQRLTAASRAPDIVSMVERVLIRKPRLLQPSGDGGGVAATAAVLCLHPRTLQRRLAARGVCYSELLGQVRYRMALKALDDPSVTLEMLSQRLGFSDRRSFTRAFVQWSGMTPAAYRCRGASPDA
ncbi:MAG: AraC family transcriptional regulator [Sinobacteraceae bacterium]|nr:AraC family transcriptional regulator [Nevskiaceae bacterium]